MDLSPFFMPADIDLEWQQSLNQDQIGSRIKAYLEVFPDWSSADVVMLGCGDPGEEGEYAALAKAPDVIRKQFYSLSFPVEGMQLADIGNLWVREEGAPMYDALAYVVQELIRAGKVVLILGGTQALTYGQYMAYEEQGKRISYVHVDSALDVQDSEIILDSRSFNHRIFLHRPDFLASFVNLGYQRFLIPEEELRMLRQLHYSAIRYGDLSGQIAEVEPYLRSADMLSFDLSAIRQMEAPAASRLSPGGFTAMEAIRIARYAGMSYGLSSFSIWEMDTKADIRDQTSALAAIMCWYFIDGFYNRKDDLPRDDRANLQKYTVHLHGTIHEIHFFRHPSSDRWWMEVPDPESPDNLSKAELVPCSEKDYLAARADEIPDRWWQAYHRRS